MLRTLPRCVYSELHTLGARAGNRRRFASRSYAITAEEVQRFHRDGFIIVRGLISAEELQLVRTALETDKSLTENQFELNDEAGGSTKLTLWSNPGNGTLGSLTCSARVVRTMQRLLRMPLDPDLTVPILHYHSKVLLKPPNEGGVWNWHQDYGYWYKDFFLLPHMATAYFAIDPQTKSNGCLKILRGSHLLGRLDHWSKGDQQGADLRRVALAKERFEEVECLLEPGDGVFFSASVLHSSQGNHSDTRRLALASCYTRADNVQYANPYIPCVPCPEVADEELLGRGLVLTSGEDKQMLNPEFGKQAARKDDDTEWYEAGT